MMERTKKRKDSPVDLSQVELQHMKEKRHRQSKAMADKIQALCLVTQTLSLSRNTPSTPSPSTEAITYNKHI